MEEKKVQISPLIEYAANIIRELDSTINESRMNNFCSMFSDFIEGKIDFSTISQYCLKEIGNKTPAEKIEAILKCRNDKIPPPHEEEKNENSNRKKTRSWGTYEDNRLFMAVHLFGSENWASVAQFVGNGRSKSQCSQRWIRVLDPRISKQHWTQQEEEKLCNLILKYGDKNWMKVASEIGNRSDVQCRYKYQQLQKEGHAPILHTSHGSEKTERQTISNSTQQMFEQKTTNRNPFSPIQNQSLLNIHSGNNIAPIQPLLTQSSINPQNSFSSMQILDSKSNFNVKNGLSSIPTVGHFSSAGVESIVQSNFPQTMPFSIQQPVLPKADLINQDQKANPISLAETVKQNSSKDFFRSDSGYFGSNIWII